MAKKRETKTNAMRMLDAAGAQHDVITWECETALSGVEVAELLGEDCDQVFKTLVTQGKSGEHYVFMVPVACELDLKKAAATVGEKSVAMIKARDLLPDAYRFVTGLIDSDDISLNISREILQHDRQLRFIAGNLEKKIKGELERMRDKDRETYEKLFAAFGQDFAHQTLMNCLTGGGVCALVLLGALGMMLHGRKRRNEIGRDAYAAE